MNNLMKVSNATEYIANASVSQVLSGINNMVNAYKEYKIADTMEATKRAAIREQARIEISALQEATKRELHRIDGKVDVSLECINSLNNILQMRDVLDDNMMKVCVELIHGATAW